MPAPTLIILAAGIGSRYGGLKQMEPVGPSGESIIDYSVYDALLAGFGRVVLVIKEEIQAAFRERIGRTLEAQCDTAYVLQRMEDLPVDVAVPPGRLKPWGTAHATLCCRHAVDGPFAVINADDFYGRGALKVLGAYLADEAKGTVRDYCVVAYPLEKTLSEYGPVARGICRLTKKGTLAEIRERTRIQRVGDRTCYADGEQWVELAPGTQVSMNMWGLTPRVFPQLEGGFRRFLDRNRADLERCEYYLPEAVGELVRGRRARVRVLPTDETWYGVTYQQDKPQVKEAIQRMVRQGLYPERLWDQGR
jgi:NDP-sugar pyrophosphorylase family protein